ncbi:hypothetical protein LI328DRAFT_40278 [Trichoderma asperelloides]|nr:hypothetical protein LI328DRAFT_40278 [Trichoderma asperelloides]
MLMPQLGQHYKLEVLTGGRLKGQGSGRHSMQAKKTVDMMELGNEANMAVRTASYK